MKRIISLILALGLLLTACGGGADRDASVPSFQDTAPETTEATVPTQAPTEEVTTQPAPVGQKLILEGVAYDCMDDLMEALHAEGRLEQEEHSITIEGLQTPVTFHLRYGTLVGYTVYDYTFDVEQEAQAYTGLYGDLSADLYDYQDAVILNVWHGAIGYTLIMMPDGGWVHYPTEGRSLMVYADETGALLCSQMAVKFNDSIHRWDTAPIDLANSRDDFYYATGTCTIEGQDVVPVLVEEFTISDVFDLDEIFAQGKADGFYPEYDTVDQLLAWNWADQHQPGDGQEDDDLWYTYWEDSSLKRQLQFYGEYKVSANTYDAQGRLTHRVHYDHGTEGHSFQYTYDEKGQVTEVICRQYDNEIFRYAMTYDDAGRLIQRARYKGDVQTGLHSFAYGEDGSSETFIQNGQKKYTYHFDSEGTLTRHITYRDGIATETEDVGSLVKAQLLLEGRLPIMDNSPINYSFRYDGCDLIHSTAFYGSKEETTYDGSYYKPQTGILWPEYEDGTMDSVWSYDEAGRMTQRIYMENGTQVGKEEYTYQGDTQVTRCYDDQGELICEFHRTYEDGFLTEHESRTEEGVYREVYCRSGDTVEVTTYRDGVQESQYTQSYDESGRLLCSFESADCRYSYDDGMLQTIFLAWGGCPTGIAFFDYREVYVTEAQARELTDIMNEVLEWIY